MPHTASRMSLALALLFALGGSACSRMTLHRSFGQRVHDFNAAQAIAHPTRDVVVRGVEAESILQTYTGMFESTANDAATKGIGGGGGKKTAGISPLN